MWSDSTLAGNSSRPAILQLRIESDQELYQAYIPSFQGGGLFVPTSRPYQLGDELYGLLSIGEDPQRHPLVGKVAWVTPANHSATRQRGVGIRFNGAEKTKVYEYNVAEGWVRVEVPTAKDRRGNPMVVKLSGTVEPYYRLAE